MPEHFKSIEAEQYRTVGLRRFIDALYPTTKGTRIPQFISHIASDLEQVVEKNPLSYNLPKLKNSILAVRGSSIKRINLGTPPGYWRISEFFRSINQKNLDPLTQDIVQQLGSGPDLDFVFKPAQNYSAQDVFSTILNSLQTQGFRVSQTEKDKVALEITGRKTRQPYDDYHVTVSYKEHGDPQSHPVKAVVVDINYLGKPVLKVDFIQAPDKESGATNFRLSGASAPFDLISLGYIHKTNDGKILLSYETDLADSLNSPKLFRYIFKHSRRLLLNSYNSAIRTAYQRTMWFNNFSDNNQVTFGNYSLPEMLKQINLVWGNMRLETEEEWLNSLKDGSQLQARLPGLISGFLVGLTYDPFLFLKLAYETQLLSYLPIGKIINSPAALQEITSLMAKECGTTHLEGFRYIPFRDLYDQDSTNTLPLLSADYQTGILLNESNNLKYTGSFILLRALNSYLQMRGYSPVQESLPEVISLFNPLIFYQERIQKLKDKSRE